MAKDPELEVDLTPLATALAKVTEEMARKVVQDALPALIKPEMEQALKATVPGMVESAVAEEKVLIKESAQELARQMLPDLLKPIVEQLAKEIIEQVAKDMVATTAEAEVMKEIERLKAEA